MQVRCCVLCILRRLEVRPPAHAALAVWRGAKREVRHRAGELLAQPAQPRDALLHRRVVRRALCYHTLVLPEHLHRVLRNPGRQILELHRHLAYRGDPDVHTRDRSGTRLRTARSAHARPPPPRAPSTRIPCTPFGAHSPSQTAPPCP